jgi:SAM-dependent methyltransferase
MLTIIIDRLRKHGFRRAWRSLLSYVRSHQRTDDFDRRHGIDTAGIVPLWRFPADLPGLRFAGRYQPAHEDAVICPLTALDEDWSEFTFVDIGAGKGKALIVAARCGFKSLIGVEFVPALAQTAAANLTKLGIENAIVICRDAAEYRFPPGDLVVFFYDPFAAELMRAVIGHLRQDATGKLYVIYVNPRHEAAIWDSRFLKLKFCAPHVNAKVWEFDCVRVII